MADKRDRRRRNGTRPESTPASGNRPKNEARTETGATGPEPERKGADISPPGTGGRTDTSTSRPGSGRKPGDTPALDTPPAPGNGDKQTPEAAGPADRRIPAEEMPPLAADLIGPAPDPAAARPGGTTPSRTAAGTGASSAAPASGRPGSIDPAGGKSEASTSEAAGSEVASAPKAGDRQGSATPGAPIHETAAPKSDFGDLEPGPGGTRDELGGTTRPTGGTPETSAASRTGEERTERPPAAAMASGSGTTEAGRPATDERRRRRSPAGILLVALLLLLAGAALGIWAGPRIAPHLPAGMAPVAEWLAPRDVETVARLAALENDMAAEIAALRAEIEAVAAEDPTAGIETRLAAIEDDLGSRIESLAAELQALDGTATRQRLSQLETALEGERETLASLSEQLSAAAGSASAEIDTYRAELAGLRGEVQETVAQVAALSRRIDEVAAQAAQQVDLARARVAEIEEEAAAELDRATIEAALAEIRSALASGTPFSDAAARLAEGPGVPAGLLNAAPAGVPTVAQLRDRFPQAANAAIQASIQSQAAQGDVLDRLGGFFRSQVASRSLEPREGDDADAILSRMEAALRSDDLDTALSEAEALPPEAAGAMADWLAAARARQEAVTSFETLQAELSATN